MTAHSGDVFAMPRTWLFAPAHRERMMSRVAESPADAVILDLEDSVPDAEKDAARTLLASTLDALAPQATPYRFVRVNEFGRYAAAHADLDAAVRPGLAGIVLPKVESAEAIIRFDAVLEVWEAQRGLPAGAVRIVALIESPHALLHATSIAAASARVIALAFGREDYRREFGAMQPDSPTLTYARAAIVTAAAAARVQAIDAVWTDLDDADGLGREAAEARQMGFAGKMVIHPAQVEAVNTAFVPTAAEVEFAREAIVAYEAAVARGEGAVSFRGQMLDVPVIARARRTLADSARVAGGNA